MLIQWEQLCGQREEHLIELKLGNPSLSLISLHNIQSLSALHCTLRILSSQALTLFNNSEFAFESQIGCSAQCPESFYGAGKNARIIHGFLPTSLRLEYIFQLEGKSIYWIDLYIYLFRRKFSLLCLAIASVCTGLGFLQPVVNAFILMLLGVSTAIVITITIIVIIMLLGV